MCVVLVTEKVCIPSQEIWDVNSGSQRLDFLGGCTEPLGDSQELLGLRTSKQTRETMAFLALAGSKWTGKRLLGSLGMPINVTFREG